MNCGIFWTKAKETLGQSRKAKGWIGWKGWKPGLVNGYGSRKSPCFIGKMWEKYGKVIYNWAIFRYVGLPEGRPVAELLDLLVISWLNISLSNSYLSLPI